jgi:hypothetical protein
MEQEGKMNRLTFKEDGKWILKQDDNITRAREREELAQQAIDRLAEYEDMEEQGLLVRLPCKVGDRVYQVIDDCTFPGDCGTKRMCKGCEYRNLFIEKNTFRLYLLTDDGKLRRGYYRTREEAEKALEGNNEQA